MKLRLRFISISKKFVRYEPADPSLAVGTLYLSKSFLQEPYHDLEIEMHLPQETDEEAAHRMDQEIEADETAHLRSLGPIEKE